MTPAAHEAPLRTEPELGSRGIWGLWFALVLGVGLMFFAYRYLDGQTNARPVPWKDTLIDELTGAFASGLLYLILEIVVARFPILGPQLIVRTTVYGLAFVGYAVLHTSFMWLSRSLLYPVLVGAAYDYGQMPLRYWMEAPLQLIGFSLLVGFLHVRAHLRSLQQQRMTAIKLERDWAEARLDNLRLQLQPHFLFNTLHAISSTMYEDLDRADEMIDALGELLRASLNAEGGALVPLREELQILDGYLSIMHARFGRRLIVTRDIDPDCLDLGVPPLCLQPLVENAIRHGSIDSCERLRIEVRAKREAGHMYLTITDDGRGCPVDCDPLDSGLGLRATRERFALLYGPAFEFRVGNVGDRAAGAASGFRVEISVPAGQEVIQS